MAGSDGFGTKFYKMSGTASTAIGGITAINGPEIEGEDIDVTDMDSANGFMEFLPGLVDGGEVELELNYDKDEQAVLYALIRTTAAFKIVGSDSSKWDFSGYLKGLGQEYPHDDKISSSATLKISGKPTHATS